MMSVYEHPNYSAVELKAIEDSPLDPLYPPEERIPVITVGNFPALGQLIGMQFLHWVQNHPGGVISLPTGKTPEHFIKWVNRTMRSWDEPATQASLERNGVDPGRKPDMRGLHFVQIDEFYPIQPTQKNSFHYYVKKYYIEGMGLDPQKALLMNCNEIGISEEEDLKAVWPDSTVDLSLRTRQPVNNLERVQQDVLWRIDGWCQRREERIRELGGLGFFLGGIGPDGHIGFNIRGSDHFSTTRLMATNYETQAAAAGDLGGIEVARRRLVITIGLGTITFNRDCTAIIVAAGEAKAGVIADAVQGEVSVRIPASALRVLPNARFYITLGAAKKLRRRQVKLMVQSEDFSDEQVVRAMVDLSLARKKPLLELNEREAAEDPMLREILKGRQESFGELAELARNTLIRNIERGSSVCRDTRFLHTEPHHDDLMLGYLPHIVRNMRDPSNLHHFVTLTSGFTAVTNQFMLSRLDGLQRWIDSPEFLDLARENYFDVDNEQGRNRDIWQYLDGIAARNNEMRAEGAARRLLRNLMEVYDENNLSAIRDRMTELRHYLASVYPGRKDPEVVQQLKGMCREWEAETLWGYFGWQCSNIRHLRLGFYTGDIFVPEPTVERDVAPVLDLFNEVQPHIISCALDPEASGPDTHYKVLQAIADATDRHVEKHAPNDLRVWGYRNVWFRFHPSEANVFVPVSLNMLSIMENAFLNTFVSQREASFPSHAHDGPFCELAQHIQVDQYQMLKTCLGRAWFSEHSSALIRGARGFVYLREMTLAEFRRTARGLRKSTEDL
ncbi:MAG: glucosamine-6-phosphate deaminase [Planctomycetota bacterium]